VTTDWFCQRTPSFNRPTPLPPQLPPASATAQRAPHKALTPHKPHARADI